MKAVLLILDNRLKGWIQWEKEVTSLSFMGKEEIVLRGNYHIQNQTLTEEVSEPSFCYPIQLLSSASLENEEVYKKALELLLAEGQNLFEKAITPWLELNLNEPIPTLLIHPSALPQKALQLFKKQFSMYVNIKKQLKWSQLVSENYFTSTASSSGYAVCLEWLGEDFAIDLIAQKEENTQIVETQSLSQYGYSPMVIGIANYILFLYKQNRGSIPFSKQSVDFHMLLNQLNEIYLKIEQEESSQSLEKIYFRHSQAPFELNLEKSELEKSKTIKDTINTVLEEQFNQISQSLEKNHLKHKNISVFIGLGSPRNTQMFSNYIRNKNLVFQKYDMQELAEIAYQKFFVKKQESIQIPINSLNNQPHSSNANFQVKEYLKLATKELKTGFRVAIYWPTSRGLKLRVISPGEFFARLEVQEIIGTSANLKKGDVLRVAFEICVGEYLEVDLLRDNQDYGTYKSGAPITKIELWNST